MADFHDNSINLRALQKMDPTIKDILQEFGQVAVYYYTENKKWERKNIEGPLFFCRRTRNPTDFAFVVINRLNTQNLFQELFVGLETSVTSPYFMYKSQDDDILCIWFYEEKNATAFEDYIKKTMELLKPSDKPTTSSEILQMIMKQYKNKEGESDAGRRLLLNDELPRHQMNSSTLSNYFSSSLNFNGTSSLKSLNQSNGEIGNVKPIKQELAQPGDNPRQSLVIVPSKETNSVNRLNNVISTNTTDCPKPMSSLPHALAAKLHKTNSDGPLHLTMEQLKQTLVYLLQNDADFLHTIHTAYVSQIKK